MYLYKCSFRALDLIFMKDIIHLKIMLWQGWYQVFMLNIDSRICDERHHLSIKFNTHLVLNTLLFQLKIFPIGMLKTTGLILMCFFRWSRLGVALHLQHCSRWNFAKVLWSFAYWCGKCAYSAYRARFCKRLRSPEIDS
jgi:hypothetical protein